jgi:hypothetical protein
MTTYKDMFRTLPDLTGSSAVVSDRHNCQIPETFKFEGERECETPVTDLHGLVEMIFLFPGSQAAESPS